MNKTVTRLSAVLLTATAILARCHRAPAPGDLAAGLRASQLDDWDEATARWEKAAALRPGDAAARNNLAVAYESRGLWDKARGEYEAALALAPADVCIRDNFARFQAGQVSASVDDTRAEELSAARVAGRCRSVPVRLPGLVPAGLEKFEEVVIVDFREKEVREDVRLGPDLADYFADEIRRGGRRPVARLTATAAAEGAMAEADLLKGAEAGRPRALLLAGDVGLSEEAQKGLRADAPPKDGPFRTREKVLEERKLITLALAVRVYDAASGEILFRKDIEDVRTYPRLDYPPSSALVELFEGLKNKLFPLLFGDVRSETRHVLLR